MDESRYDIIGRLADGAMGQVYLARRFPPLDGPQHLVLKRIRPELQTDPNIVMMFQDEARLAAQMNHPNIVRLYEVGELDGSLFLAMELVEGVTVENLLATLVDQRRFIPIELGLTIAHGILSALNYAHTFKDAEGRPLNIVHRDVSPQNLMVSYGGEVKLLDFGVTRAEGRLHQTLPGLLKGKLAYMAPETIEGRPIDGRSDLFSLGSVLYEMLLLKHPFFGSTDAMVLRSIVEEPPVHPADLDPEFPSDLAELMLDALAKDPEHRIDSAADFKVRIETFLT
ncbi:MAG: serine/threonine-protein kinase, partial [Myxococcota bacterium]